MGFVTQDINFFLNSIKIKNLTLIPDSLNSKLYYLGSLHNDLFFDLNNIHKDI